MISMLRYFAAALAVVSLAACSTAGNFGMNEHSTQAQAELATKAASVLQRQMSQPPQERIPNELVANAKCIAVFPSIIQAGFIIGGHRGKGLVSCRHSSTGWSQSAPVIYTISGGSVGLQAGVQQSSVILLFETRDSVNPLLHSKFKLAPRPVLPRGQSALTRIWRPVRRHPSWLTWSTKTACMPASA